MGIKWDKVDYVEDENPWVTYCKYKVFERNNCINAIFTGRPGSGKSWAMLSLAHKIDPDFKLEGNWFFKAGKMMRAVKEYYDKDDCKVGKFWCLDEAGIDLNNLKYHDEINRGLNAFFQTARHRNYIFFCSVPYINFVSKGVRTLMTSTFLTRGWTKRNQTKIMPRVLEYNPNKDYFYTKRLVVIKDKDKVMCNNILLPRPPAKIRREYEKLKKEFTSQLFEDTATRIENFEMKQYIGAKSVITEKQQEVLDYLKEGLTPNEIAIKQNIVVKNVYAKMTSLKKLGIRITCLNGNYIVNDPRDTK